MFTKLFTYPAVVARHKTAPYAESRERFLVHCADQGYAHASLHLVERGQRVREREVIALSGSTGQSTAPHLHFEILLNGEAVDPLTMVEQPS